MNTAQLSAHNRSIKQRFLAMYKSANAGHVGCSLSCTEMLTFVKLNWMKAEDEVILSKGHAAAVLYSVLAEAGDVSEEQIKTFYKNDTYLAAHPPTNKLKGIPFATGSLGHGLSIACGLGLAAKLKKTNKTIFCVTSDGEINEGSTWEAALFIAHHQLKNVVWLIDRNRLQGFGKTEEVMRLDPLDKKLEAFGFHVVEINGHDFEALKTVKLDYPSFSKPLAVICNTTKGHGWAKYEGMVDCHYLPMKEEDFEQLSAYVETH